MSSYLPVKLYFCSTFTSRSFPVIKKLKTTVVLRIINSQINFFYIFLELFSTIFNSMYYILRRRTRWIKICNEFLKNRALSCWRLILYPYDFYNYWASHNYTDVMGSKFLCQNKSRNSFRIFWKRKCWHVFYSNWMVKYWKDNPSKFNKKCITVNNTNLILHYRLSFASVQRITVLLFLSFASVQTITVL